MALESCKAEDTNHQAVIGTLTGLFKFRIGDYRVLYKVLHQEKTLPIHASATDAKYTDRRKLIRKVFQLHPSYICI